MALVAWLVVLAAASPASAAWVLPAGQEAAVEALVAAVLPDLPDPAIAIHAGEIDVNVGAAVVTLRRGDAGKIVASVKGDGGPDVAALQARIDATATTLRWVEVAAAPEGVVAGAAPAPVPTVAGETGVVAAAGALSAGALDLERRAGFEREKTRRAAIDAIDAIDAKARPDWLELEAALLLRADGQDEAGRKRAAAVAERLKGARAADPKSGVAVRVRALAIAGDDDAALALADAAGGDGCASVALLERAAVLRDDEAMLRTGDRLVATHCHCAGLFPPLASTMRRIGAYDRVGAMLERGVEAHPNDGFIVRQLAYVRARQERVDDVFALLDKAMEIGIPVGSDLVEVSHIATVVRAPDAWVAKLAAQVDAHPDDLDAAFLLGVVLHYRDDWMASDVALQKAEPKHDKIARLWIYRAMNHYRVGDFDKAATLIERAAALGAEDPDVLYCRAVIGLDHDPVAARADLDSYLAHTHGTAEVNPHKQARVRLMLEDLVDCGSAQSPRACLGDKAMMRTATPWALAAGAALLLLGLLLLLRKRRRRASTAALVLLTLLAAVPAMTTSARAEASAPVGPLIRGSAGYSAWVDTARPPPRALVAQLSWLDDVDTAQVAVAAGLWTAVLAALFFSAPASSVPRSLS